METRIYWKIYWRASRLQVFEESNQKKSIKGVVQIE